MIATCPLSSIGLVFCALDFGGGRMLLQNSRDLSSVLIDNAHVIVDRGGMKKKGGFSSLETEQPR